MGRHLRAHRFSLALLGACLVWPSIARAQNVSQVDLQNFKPSMDSAGQLNMNVGGTGGHLTTRGGIWLDYSRKLLRTEIDGTSVKLGDVVSNRVDATAIATLSLFNRLEIGVAMPFNIFQNGLNTDLVRDVIGKEELSKNGASDLRLMLKGNLLPEGEARPAIALVVEGSVPTGDAHELRSEPSWTLAPNVAVSKRLGSFQVMANVGYRYRNDPARIYNIPLEDELFYRIGGSYAIPRRGGPSLYGVVASLYGQTPTDDIFGLANKDRAIVKNPIGVIVAGQRRIATSVGNFRVTMGIGTGVAPGYGSPQIRGIFAFDYLNREPFDDDDSDGIVNVNDRCAGVAEDLDDFEDADGCPELDNDHDAIEDIDDECPNAPEDKDNYEDFDGCAEVSELDGDLDGVSDAQDRCQDSKEDFDGHQDEDGCVDNDNDGDGLSDLSDLCPDEFEDQATSVDKDGCPAGIETQALAMLGRGVITTSIPIAFKDNALAPTASSVLNQVALILREHNEIVTLEVQVAPMKSTLKRAADRRAKAVVDYLIARGVDKSRLVAAGQERVGPKPGAVRFVITKQIAVRGAVPPKAAPKPTVAPDPVPAPFPTPSSAPAATPAPTTEPGASGALTSDPPAKSKAKAKAKRNKPRSSTP